MKTHKMVQFSVRDKTVVTNEDLAKYTSKHFVNIFKRNS